MPVPAVDKLFVFQQLRKRRGHAGLVPTGEILGSFHVAV